MATLAPGWRSWSALHVTLPQTPRYLPKESIKLPALHGRKLRPGGGGRSAGTWRAGEETRGVLELGWGQRARLEWAACRGGFSSGGGQASGGKTTETWATHKAGEAYKQQLDPLKGTKEQNDSQLHSETRNIRNAKAHPCL